MLIQYFQSKTGVKRHGGSWRNELTGAIITNLALFCKHHKLGIREIKDVRVIKKKHEKHKRII